MNTLDLMYKEAKKPQEYVRSYFDYLATVLKTVDENKVAEMIDAFLNARKDGHTIYFIGNGGSAATASHFANDISIGTRTKDRHFKAVSLTDNVAILTALGNDEGYDFIFQKQLEVLIEKGDILVAISASGNSPNLIKAVEFVKAKGNKVIGLTGFDGGKLKALSDISVHLNTPKGEYGPVEDFHMIIDHLIGTYLYRVIHSS